MEVTELLRQAQAGDREALNQVIPLVYKELKSIAAYHLRRESSAVRLETTALVHEAYMRLVGVRQDYENRSHFCAIAARIMRQILVDHARTRGAAKRGVGQEIYIAELSAFGEERDDFLVRLDDALATLGRSEPLKTQLIEMRYFGGLTLEESSQVLGLPLSAVRRELRLAQAWLGRELAR